MVGPGVPRVQMCGLADDCPGQHVQDVRDEGLVEVPGWVGGEEDGYGGEGGKGDS